MDTDQRSGWAPQLPVRTLAVKGLSPSSEGAKGFIPQGPRIDLVSFIGLGAMSEGGLCLLA